MHDGCDEKENETHNFCPCIVPIGSEKQPVPPSRTRAMDLTSTEPTTQSETPMEMETVLRACTLHNKYWNCDLHPSRPAAAFDAASTPCYGLISHEQCMYPGEIAPLRIPRGFDYVCIQVGEDDQNEPDRMGLLAVVVAEQRVFGRGSSAISRNRPINVLVRGLGLVEFRQSGAHHGKVVGVFEDWTLPRWLDRDQAATWKAGMLYKRLRSSCEMLDPKITYSWAASDLLLSAETSLAFLKLRDSMLRNFLVWNVFPKIEDRSMRCKSCFTKGTNTILCDDNMARTKTACFANPDGFVFRLLLIYDPKPGELATMRNIVHFGFPTSKFSWYPGFAWSFARCQRCGEILGWRFVPILREMNEVAFWGIRSAMVKNSDETIRAFE